MGFGRGLFSAGAIKVVKLKCKLAAEGCVIFLLFEPVVFEAEKGIYSCLLSHWQLLCPSGFSGSDGKSSLTIGGWVMFDGEIHHRNKRTISSQPTK